LTPLVLCRPSFEAQKVQGLRQPSLFLFLFLFPFVTVVDSTANVVLGGVLNSPPRRFWGVGVDGANGSKSLPAEFPAVDELLLLFGAPIQLTAVIRQLLHCLAVLTLTLYTEQTFEGS
jgi:hypothetical protein